eukprot:TRINITY_DN22543_c0_g1_i1.p1 TRINITY_DN22543_c0_g1~~TRINITY_DN22543_c0_g1_i1.p1  ORF type:complete len:375 (+),score=63.55 TRINITY_DN22543_c0_g1_i1:32-1156(+)
MAPPPVDPKKVKAAAPSRHRKPEKNWQLQYALSFGVFAGAMCIAMVASPGGGRQTLVNDSSLIRHINHNAKTWQADPSSFFEGWTIADVKDSLNGILVSNQFGAFPECQLPSIEVPVNFDAREKWPSCFEYPVYEMGNCSSSWAIATASATGNRFCIADPTANARLRLAPQQLLSCDKNINSKGCSGGMLDFAWQFVKHEGLVSEDCFPYQADSSVPCESRCDSKASRRVGSVCRVADEEAMRREILMNGPVVATIMLVDDFLTYSSGIYHEMSTATQLVNQDGQRQLHAIKILGWGMEGKQAYWIIENSWGSSWGERGFARIAAGDATKKQTIFLQEWTFAGTPASSKLGLSGSASEDAAALQESEDDDEEAM